MDCKLAFLMVLLYFLIWFSIFTIKFIHLTPIQGYSYTFFFFFDFFEGGSFNRADNKAGEGKGSEAGAS